MSGLYRFCLEFFEWCRVRNISAVMARPKQEEADFTSGDIDIISSDKDHASILRWLEQSPWRITCDYARSDGHTCHLYDQESDDYFHVDFIYHLEVKGIAYLSVKDVLLRSDTTQIIHRLDDIDQFIILVMTHGLKHKQDLLSYRVWLEPVLRHNNIAVLNSLMLLFGSRDAAKIYDAILLGTSASITFSSFFSNAWALHGFIPVIGYIRHHVKELARRFRMPIYRVAVLGMDGAGKSTLINRLKTRMHDAVPEIRHARFIPAWPWQQEKDSSILLNNPHAHPLRSRWASLLKLGYFSLRYGMVKIMPRRYPVLYLHDRYVTDMIADPVRYRYNGPKNFPFWLYPKPEITILLDVRPETAISRKQELPLHELQKLQKAYRRMATQDNTMIVISEHSSATEAVNIAEKAIRSVLR